MSVSCVSPHFAYILITKKESRTMHYYTVCLPSLFRPQNSAWQHSKSKRSKGKIILSSNFDKQNAFNLSLNSASFWFLGPLSVWVVYVFVASTDMRIIRLLSSHIKSKSRYYLLLQNLHGCGECESILPKCCFVWQNQKRFRVSDRAHETEWDLWKNIMALAIIAVGLLIIAYIQLRRIKKLK